MKWEVCGRRRKSDTAVGCSLRGGAADGWVTLSSVFPFSSFSSSPSPVCFAHRYHFQIAPSPLLPPAHCRPCRHENPALPLDPPMFNSVHPPNVRLHVGC